MTEPGDVVVFAPHPDDEVIACAGSILNRIEAGCRVHICFSTDGSRSHQAVLNMDEPSPATLAQIRMGEAVRAAAALGVPAHELTFVGACDTRLVEALDRLRAAVDRVLASRSDLQEVFLPHERRELNADHSHTGSVVLERLKAATLTPIIYKYVVWDDEVERSFGFVNRQADRPLGSDEEVLYSEDIASRLEAKYAALMQHRTQVELFAPGQSRTVIPPELMERVRTRPVEEFWVARRGA